MPPKNKPSNSSLSIGGNANTNGGDIAGGDITKGNVYRASKINILEVSNLFQPIYDQISQSQNIAPRTRGKLIKYVQEIQAEVSKGEKVKKGFLDERIENIAHMSPDILEVLVSTLANPIIGLGVIARKIADKAIQISSKDIKKNE